MRSINKKPIMIVAIILAIFLFVYIARGISFTNIMGGIGNTAGLSKDYVISRCDVTISNPLFVDARINKVSCIYSEPVNILQCPVTPKAMSFLWLTDDLVLYPMIEGIKQTHIKLSFNLPEVEDTLKNFVFCKKITDSVSFQLEDDVGNFISSKNA